VATSTVDLSSLQGINFGGGQTGFYDPTSGTYFDSGGNALSASDLAQYGAFTVGTGLAPPPGTSPGGGGAPTPASGAGSGGMLSGLGGIFSSVTTTIANATRPQTLPSSQGTLVYNPQTGGYTPAQALTAQSMMSPILLLGLAGLVVYFLMRKG